MRDYYDKKGIADSINPIDLLYWRAVDMMLGQMLSEQFNVQHYVIAVSHPLKVLSRLLFRPHASVYAGHPITDIRKKDPGESKRLMNRINSEFVAPLSENDSIVMFLPDTIEEDLFLDATSLRSLGEKMWPRAWGPKEPLIVDSPTTSEELHFSDLVKIVSNSKQIYQSAIGGQMSDRDYRLVNQVKNFVFTLLKEIPSSPGVEAEFFQAKYSEKEHNIYFFNPDRIERKSGGPRWATNATGEYHDIKRLADELLSDLEPPFIRIS